MCKILEEVANKFKASCNSFEGFDIAGFYSMLSYFLIVPTWGHFIRTFDIQLKLSFISVALKLFSWFLDFDSCIVN